jgi:hypothetical protein
MGEEREREEEEDKAKPQNTEPPSRTKSKGTLPLKRITRILLRPTSTNLH